MKSGTVTAQQSIILGYTTKDYWGSKRFTQHSWRHNYISLKSTLFVLLLLLTSYCTQIL